MADAMEGPAALNAAAGALAGGSVLVMLFPIDVVKTHMQTRGLGMVATARLFASAQTVGGLYRGLSPALTEQIINRFILFGLASWLRQQMPRRWPDLTCDVVGGASAAMIKTTLLHPVDTIKCRMQLGQGVRSSLSGQGGALGLRGLYNGYAPAVARSSVGMSIWLASRNFLERALAPADADADAGRLAVWRHAICGFLSSTLTDICTFPLDTLKKNLQAAPVSGRRTVSSEVERLRRAGGLERFYRGFGPRLLMVGLNGALFNVNLVALKRVLGPLFSNDATS